MKKALIDIDDIFDKDMQNEEFSNAVQDEIKKLQHEVLKKKHSTYAKYHK